MAIWLYTCSHYQSKGIIQL